MLFNKRSHSYIHGLLLCMVFCDVCIKETWSKKLKSCPNGWRPYGTKKNMLTCIWFSNDKASWIDAMNWCKVLGGQLVEIGTQDFNQFLMRLTRGQSGKYWIGSTDIELETEYKWMTSGEPTSLTFFYPGQFYSTKSKNCVATDEKAFWSVEDCKAEFSFICQQF